MANIPIWPGSSSFAAGDTPFSFYDADTDFQTDAVTTAAWCATRLGYPLVDIELQAVNFFTCFEEAINEYGAYRLAAIIHSLRSQGHNIQSKRVDVPTRYSNLNGTTRMSSISEYTL